MQCDLVCGGEYVAAMISLAARACACALVNLEHCFLVWQRGSTAAAADAVSTDDVDHLCMLRSLELRPFETPQKTLPSPV